MKPIGHYFYLKKDKKFLNRLSLTFLALTYFIEYVLANGNLLYSSLLLLLFLFLDFTFFFRLENKVIQYPALIFFNITFYSLIFYYDTNDHIDINIGLRAFILLYFFACLVIYYFVIFKGGLRFHNIFFILFAITSLFKAFTLKKYNEKELLSQWSPGFNSPTAGGVEKSTRPVVFIILDELSSSQETFNYTKDSD